MSIHEPALNPEQSDSGDESKMSWHDCLVTLLQVASAVGVCQIVNLVAT